MLDHPPGLQLTFSGIGGVRQLTFEEDSLVLEARDNLTGMLQPEEEIFWEEVRGVYLWKRPDWVGVGATALPLLALAFYAFALADGMFHFEGLSSVTLLLAALTALVVLAVVVFVKVKVQPRRCVRVVSDDREICFHTTEKRYIRTLLHRLNVPVPPEYEVR